MKKLKVLFAVLIAFATFQSVNAQSDKLQRTIGIKTQTIHVNGVCEMDKNRIENAALKVEGIKSAAWNVDTKMLTVTYGVFKKDAVNNVEKVLASIGHDNEKFKATDVAYNNLPLCCHYRRQ